MNSPHSPRVRYQTIEIGDTDIHLCTLRDKQQFSDPLGEAEALGISSAQWSLFGVVWDASKVLAQEMLHFDIRDKRILEVGCGIALSSHLLNARHADISASDYHPEAATFLRDNVALNKGEAIPFLRADWNEEYVGLGKFDVIIGSDLLYEQEHGELLSQFINRHASENSEIIMVDPGRGKHAGFSKKMVELGFSHEQYIPQSLCGAEPPSKMRVLKYARSL
jgi:predicted nicotinamide N-methyase